MPFVNGRFYINPAYGRALERARATGSTPPDQDSRGAEGHWVTIDHRHILIHETVGQNPHEASHEGRSANLERRARIAEIARKHNGDTSMPYTPDHPTCNLFVQRAIAESGAPKPLVKKADGTLGAPSAAEWANSPIPGWRFLQPGEKPQPGDVAAWPLHYSDATGHSGIVIAVDNSGHVTAIAAHQREIGIDNSFNPSREHPEVTYRRYMGG